MTGRRINLVPGIERLLYSADNAYNVSDPAYRATDSVIPKRVPNIVGIATGLVDAGRYIVTSAIKQYGQVMKAAFGPPDRIVPHLIPDSGDLVTQLAEVLDGVYNCRQRRNYEPLDRSPVCLHPVSEISKICDTIEQSNTELEYKVQEVGECLWILRYRQSNPLDRVGE
jgi:hypothetical protein